MLKNISWSDYWAVVIILGVIYYLYVGVRYFFTDLKDLVSGERKLKFKATVPDDNQAAGPHGPGESKLEASSFEESRDDEFTKVEHLIERLKAVIGEASRRKLILEEFKYSLSMVLKDYPTVKYSPLRPSINELIVSECQKYGTITLAESEAEMLWKEATV